MSGPYDSGADGTASQDFVLPIYKDAPQPPSKRYALKAFYDTPRLEWRPKSARSADDTRSRDVSLGLDLCHDYLRGGGLLFDATRVRYDLIDKAILEAPRDLPPLPSFADMEAWRQEEFYKALGRSPPLFGAPAPPPARLMAPQQVATPTFQQFYLQGDPSVRIDDPALPKPGQVGDLLGATLGEPEVKHGLNFVNDFAMQGLKDVKRGFLQAPFLEKALYIAIPIAMGSAAVYGVLGSPDARHTVAGQLKGLEIPLFPVPGLSLRIDSFGKAGPYLDGLKPGDPGYSPYFQGFLLFSPFDAFPALNRLANGPTPNP